MRKRATRKKATKAIWCSRSHNVCKNKKSLQSKRLNCTIRLASFRFFFLVPFDNLTPCDRRLFWAGKHLTQRIMMNDATLQGKPTSCNPMQWANPQDETGQIILWFNLMQPFHTSFAAMHWPPEKKQAHRSQTVKWQPFVWHTSVKMNFCRQALLAHAHCVCQGFPGWDRTRSSFGDSKCTDTICLWLTPLISLQVMSPNSSK